MSLTPVATSFTRFDLSQTEWEEGSRLSSLQLAVIQNLIAVSAEEKIRLRYDPQNPLLFAQQEAELQGKIGILTYLIECSKSVSQPQVEV